ncbi:hypothetical protein ACS0TY_000399 [Phlomoides rotata]
MKEELLGLADNPESDQVFKSHGLNMGALYRTGESQQPPRAKHFHRRQLHSSVRSSFYLASL